MGRGQQNDESAKKGCNGSNQNDLSSWLGYRRRRQENTAFFREAGLKWWRVAKLQQYNELYWSGDRIRTCDPVVSENSNEPQNCHLQHVVRLFGHYGVVRRDATDDAVEIGAGGEMLSVGEFALAPHLGSPRRRDSSVNSPGGL
jgi:hypothetical protein